MPPPVLNGAEASHDTGGDRLPGMHDYAAIVRVHRSGQLSIRETAQHMGISRNTVRRALRTTPASEARPPEVEPASGWPPGTIELPDGGTLRIEIGNGLTPLELLTRLRDFADEQRRRHEHGSDPGKES
jgi:DNA-binding transcriptional MocR family regulator